MHRTPVPNIFSLLTCLALLFAGISAQKKADDEIELAKCWSYPLIDSSPKQIVVDSKGVYVGIDSGGIEALSLDGKKIWFSEFGGELSSNLAAFDNYLFFTTSVFKDSAGAAHGGKLRAVSSETGITNWTVSLAAADRYFLDVAGGAITLISSSGTVQAIDTKNGSIKWFRQLAEGFVAEPSFTTDKVAVATTDSQLFSVSRTTGEIESMKKVPFRVTALGARENGEKIIGDERGNIFRLNGGDKTVWTFRSGGAISRILIIEDNVLAVSQDNFVYFLTARSGGRVWKKRLAGRVWQVAKVTNDLVLLSSFEEPGAVLTNVSDGRIAGKIALDEGESLISPPAVSNDLIFVLTNAAAYGYSQKQCQQEKIKAAEG